MSSDRGRGRGGNRGGRGGSDGSSRGRGAWRNGPPPTFTPNPRMSINDHMNDMKIVQGVQNERKGFQTDTDISRTTSNPNAERELQPWVPDGPAAAATASPSPRPNGGNADLETFGQAKNIPWDQFETNERLFGAKTDFQEELYTTKLNRGGADYHKREKEADRMAKEIMGQTSKNAHVAEERGQVDTRDEEEKYSGVSRAPNAYVPPSARRGNSGQAPAAPRASVNGNQAPQAPEPPKAESPALVPPAGPARSISDEVVNTAPQSVPMKASGTSTNIQPVTEGATSSIAEQKNELSGVVNEWRQFVGTEREKVEARRTSALKTEKDKQLAELKKFQASFKVPLPMPKDMLSILTKDEAKQKDIEAKAAAALDAAKKDRKTSLAAAPSPVSAAPPIHTNGKTDAPRPPGSKKINMKIPEIPPFNAAKRKPPPVPVAESAQNDIKLLTSPTPSNVSLASTRLNPTASSFVFKPRADAQAFKPGQPSVAGSPAVSAKQPTAGPSTASTPAPAPAQNQPRGNQFFREKLPEKLSVNPREDFNPWKHRPVEQPSSVGLAWGFSGRKAGVPPAFASPAPGVHLQFDDDPNSISPHPAQPALMPGMPPNYPPFGRFQPGIPPPYAVQGMQNPMFSPPHFAPHPGQQMGQPPQHMIPGGPQHNMPMYFQNGMPHSPAFLPPQPMQQYPHTPQRHVQGPGPGGPNGPPQMFYPNQGPPMPHQTPLQQHQIPYPGHSPAQGHQPPFQQAPPPQMQMSPVPGHAHAAQAQQQPGA
ncbi:hypothetical protein I350_03957 [Cryptococcus amylolentus CBS 6273]|uniref:LsmAD domain-containing protein n=1 Tax=Cryptococcus amylolentus CBS 6273 TaxID=1296118 RepID=A0A1E3K0H6_9TREE|nr:hypothetical protein I350_03957 [Cryptococcus amylolentus CBS 6273]